MSPSRPERTTTRRSRPRTGAALLGPVVLASGRSLLPLGGGSASMQALADGSGFLVGAATNGGPGALVPGRPTPSPPQE